MKKIMRKIVFSATAIYLTALWNHGFIIKYDWMIFLKASLIITLIYYLIVPISKLILLPLNLFTFGLVSVVFYSLVLYFFLNKFSLVQIKAWSFNGPTLGLFSLPISISLLGNIFLVAFSISLIINLMEKIL